MNDTFFYQLNIDVIFIINVILESRNILLANACKHLRYHLIHRDELRLCTEILGEILSFLFKQRKTFEEQGKINNCIHHDVDTLCVNILDVLIQTVLVIIDKDTKVIVSCIVNIRIYLFRVTTLFLCKDVINLNC